MVGDAGQDVGQPRMGIDIVQACRMHQRVHDGGTRANAVPRHRLKQRWKAEFEGRQKTDPGRVRLTGKRRIFAEGSSAISLFMRPRDS